MASPRCKQGWEWIPSWGGHCQGHFCAVAEGAHLRGQFSCFFLVSWFAFSWREPGFHRQSHVETQGAHIAVRCPLLQPWSVDFSFWPLLLISPTI